MKPPGVPTDLVKRRTPRSAAWFSDAGGWGYGVTWKQAMSYCEIAFPLWECNAEAVPGLPAYTVPAWPLGLNGEPFAFTALPGVEVAPGLPQVVPGAPGCPGPFGLGSANAVAGIATAMPATAIAASSLLIGTSPWVH